MFSPTCSSARSRSGSRPASARIHPRSPVARETFAFATLRTALAGAALVGAIAFLPAFLPGTASATLIDGRVLTSPPGREVAPSGWERNGGPAWSRNFDRANPGHARATDAIATARVRRAALRRPDRVSEVREAKEVGNRPPFVPGPRIDRVDTPRPAHAVPEPSSFLIFCLALALAALPGRASAFFGPRGRTRKRTDARALARRAKRAIDVVGAIVGIALTVPLTALCAIAIKLETPGPVFFGQTRCGKNGRTFRMWKLRSMVQDAEAARPALEDRNAMSGPVFKIEADPRVTRVGRFLRRSSIDEVPQFWNVLRGEMSLVGPRPPLPCEVEQYSPRERRRLDVDPGLTCTWQVSGRNELGFEEWVELDLEYIDNWTLSRDLALIALTVPAIVNGRGSY